LLVRRIMAQLNLTGLKRESSTLRKRALPGYAVLAAVAGACVTSQAEGSRSKVEMSMVCSP